LIGEGSYGRVYYATLSNGQAAAIKKLDVSSQQESNSEFLGQVEPLIIIENGSNEGKDSVGPKGPFWASNKDLHA
jgi:hypothetical protein